jgi:hypothetical protein
MKISLKSVVAIALASAAALSAFSASADVAVPTSGNGELTLFVRDEVTGSVYARGLDLTLDSFATQATTGGAYTGPVSTGYSLPTITHDDNMTAFLGTTAGHAVTWAIMAGDSVGTTLASNPRRIAFTTGADIVATGTPANNQLIPINTSLTSFFTSVNANLPDQGGSSVFGLADAGGLFGNAGTTGETAPTLFGNGIVVTAALGAEQFFYMVTSSSTGATGTSNPAQTGRVFQALNLQLDSNGDLHSVGGSTAPVPLPAAVWLLGSGLVGLAGIRRRRAAATTVA